MILFTDVTSLTLGLVAAGVGAAIAKGFSFCPTPPCGLAVPIHDAVGVLETVQDKVGIVTPVLQKVGVTL